MKRILGILVFALTTQILLAQEFTLHEQTFGMDIYTGNNISLSAVSGSSLFLESQSTNIYNLYYKDAEDLNFKIGALEYLTVVLDNRAGYSTRIYDHQYTSESHAVGTSSVIGDCSMTYWGVFEDASNENFFFDFPKGFVRFSEINSLNYGLDFYNYQMKSAVGGGGLTSTTGLGEFSFYIEEDSDSILLHSQSGMGVIPPILKIRNEDIYNRKDSLIQFSLIKDNTPPSSPLLTSLSVDSELENAEFIYVDSTDNFIYYKSPDSGSLPPLDVSMDENATDNLSGFKCFLTNEKHWVNIIGGAIPVFFTYQMNSSFSVDLADLQGSLEIKTVDNVENISTEKIHFDILEDQSFPTAAFNLESIETRYQNTGSILLSFRIGEAVEVTDTESGFVDDEDHFSAALVSSESTFIFEKQDDGSWSVVIPEHCFDEEYRIHIIKLIDRVDNYITNSIISDAIYLPVIPQVNQNNSSFSNSDNAIKYLLELQKNRSDSMTGTLALVIESQSYSLGNLTWRGPVNGIYTANTEITLNRTGLPRNEELSAQLIYHSNGTSTAIDTWNLGVLPNQTPQAGSIILRSRGNIIPWGTDDPIPFNGQDRATVISGLSSETLQYYHPDFFGLDTVIDAEGDRFLKDVFREGEFYYVILHESFENADEEWVHLEDYLIPCRFKPDSSPPGLTGFIPQYLNGTGDLMDFPSDSGTYYCRRKPDRIRIPGLSETGAIEAAKLYDANNQFLAELPVYGKLLGYPEDLNLDEGPCSIVLYDKAWNYTEKIPLPSIIIDRTEPVPPYNANPYLARVESSVFRYIPKDASSFYLDFSSYLQQNPLEAWTINNYSIQMPGALPSDIPQIIKNDENFLIVCDLETPPNRPVTLSLEIQDLAGNTLNQEITFYTPASLTAGDIQFQKISPHESLYTDWSETLEHYIAIERASNDWETLQVEVFEDNHWQILGDEVCSGDTPFKDSGLAPHQERQYRLTPMNGSGALNRASAYSPETAVRVGNYLPSIEIITEGSSYLGPESQIHIEVLDRDGDALETWLYTGDGMEPLPMEESLLLGSLNPLLNHDQTYTFTVKTQDSWNDTHGEMEISESLSFTYDDRPPTGEAILSYKHPLRSWSCRTLTLLLDDSGVGTSSVIFNTDALNLFSQDGVPLDGEISIPLPEGSYTLKAQYSDFLGNTSRSPVLIGLVQNDQTPPVILETTPGETGQWRIAEPLVPVNIQWTDNLSGIARVEYRYSQGENVLIEGEKEPVSPSLTIEGMNLFPGLGSLEEGLEYNLKIRLIDQGGNASAWKDVSESIIFDFTPPSLVLKSWEIPRIGGQYYSTLGTIPLPVLESDRDSQIRFHLLDDQGNFLREAGDSLHLNTEGNYILQAIAEDLSGWSSQMDFSLCYDKSGPENLELQWLEGNPDALHPGETLRWGLSSQDKGSGVSSYDIKILGAQNLSRNIYPGEAQHCTITLPDDLPTGAYLLQLKSLDLLGNESESMNLPLTVNNTGEYILFRQPSYLGSDQLLSLSWEYHGPVPLSHYEVQVLGLGEDGSSILYQDEKASPDLSIALSSISRLDSCHGLRILVRPVSQAGERRGIYSSARIFLDNDAPVISMESPSIITPESLPVSWNIHDDSPIRSVNLQLEVLLEEEGQQVYSLLDSWSWEEEGRSQNQDLMVLLENNLPADAESLRLRLEVRDQALNHQEFISEPVRVDRTPAPVFTIQDQGEFINPDKNDLYFQWFWAQNDEEAGEKGYYYQLSRNGIPNPDAWEFTTEREVLFTDLSENDYPQKSQWFLMVQRENALGKEKTLYSDGIIIDWTKPEILGVELYTSADEPYEDKFFTSQNDINLKVLAKDDQSGIDGYLYQPGTWETCIFQSLNEELSSTDNLIETELPLPERAGSLLTYRVYATNGASEASLPSYSSSIMYNPTEPLIDQVILSSAEETLNIQWSVHSLAPVKEQRVLLYKKEGSISRVISSNPVSPGTRSFPYYLADLEDGMYYATVKMVDYGEHEVTGSSPELRLDRQGPELSCRDLPSYVYDQLDLHLQANEAIDRISIQLTFPNREIYSQDISLTNALMSWQEKIDFTTLPDWSYLSQLTNCEMILNLSARDKQGNWSETKQERIQFDSSRPRLNTFSLAELLWEERNISNPRLVPRSDAVEGLKLEASTEYSPIVAYRWGLSEAENDPPDYWLGYRQLSEAVKSLNLENLSLDSLNLIHGQSFYLVLQVQNKAGRYSEPAYTSLLQAHLRAPEFQLECLPENSDSSPSVYTLGPAQISLTPVNEASPFLKSSVKLISPRGEEIPLTANSQSAHDYSEILDLGLKSSFTCLIDFDKSLSGFWTLEVTLQDPFYRSTTRSLSFSANQGPILELPPTQSCRPGVPLALPYQQWMSDPQGIGQVQIYRVTGEEQTLITQSTWQEDIPLYLTLSQSSGFVTGNSYTYLLKAEDSLGAVSEAPFTLSFENTHQGILMENERWQGTHSITGPVTVATGKTLTLAAETLVQAQAGSIFGSNQEILIEAGAYLVLEGSATFTTDGANPGALWKGIRFYGPISVPPARPVTTLMENLTVENALRGITIEPGLSIRFDECNFRNNVIGLHVLSSWAELNECTFSGNLHYAIKEEAGSNPLCTDNEFDNNGYDYYDSETLIAPQGEAE